MTSTPVPDVSLYELAAQFQDSLPVLQISPATLKSVIASLVDVLIDQQIPAIVWAKLPRGEVWQAELDRCLLSSANAALQAVYLLKTIRDEGEEGAEEHANPLMPALVEETIPSSPFPLYSLPLPADNPLRREYFLLIWSAQFQAIVIAHRPRSAQPRSIGLPDTGFGLPDAVEEHHDRRQSLLTLFSVSTDLIQQVLERVEQVVLSPPPPAEPLAVALPEISNAAEAVRSWKEKLAEFPALAPDALAMGRLFMKQLQRQEEIWQRSVVYRRQAENAESLNTQNEDLVNALRLKDDFLNNLGQELRTPLTTIKTALSLLNSPSLKPPQRQRYMDLIAKECDRQSSLITSLLELVQIDRSLDESSLQAIRLSEVVPGVVSTYQPVAEEKGVRLAYTVPEDLPAISCMNNWLRQIVINLLNNSIKFTPRGGQVWVRAKQQGEFVQIEFRDTGIGIAPGEIPKIFDRFYRARASAEEASGAGLGLTIVQQLLLHCGGSISVKSKLGEGSTFSVQLPVHPSATVGE